MASMVRAASLALSAVLVFGAAAAPRAHAEGPFLLGADVSFVASRPELDRRFMEDGRNAPEILILKKHGWNTFRLRLFVDPVRQAPDNGLEKTLPLARRIKDAGALLLLDLHYSDTWADPQHQETPVAWRGLDADGLAEKVEAYTEDVIRRFREAGATPDYVQVGNEITGGMLWPLGHVRVPPSSVKLDAGSIQALPEPYDDAARWRTFIRFLKAGIQGVHAASGGHPPQIVIHIDCGGDWPVTKWFFDHLAQANVGYDVIGQSFYPFYHGTPEDLQHNLIECERVYGKPFMVAETGYPRSGGAAVMTQRKYNLWPGTPDGQLQFMADVINTVRRVPGGIGVMYWAPEGRQLGSGNSVWNAEGTPGPAVDVLPNLSRLAGTPDSHLPAPEK
jgi:arabinogalactan endo-1,4-beta-galactosidase